MKKVFVAGHRGMVGSALVRLLEKDPEIELLLRTRSELDLTNQSAVQSFFESNQIDEVYLAAARVGGIHANKTYPAEFIYDNLMMETNIIHSAYKTAVNKLLFLGSSCIYPKLATQPMNEDELLTGELEPTNEPYALAKIAGVKLCEFYKRQYACDFRSVMPTNLYGPGDNYHPENSHVIPGLIQRFHKAKLNNASKVECWGTGSPLREFLHVDDLAEACLHVMNLAQEKIQGSHINIGSGQEVSIKELVEIIKEVVGFEGDLIWDKSKPDGTPRKLLDCRKINQLGWSSKTQLKQGLNTTYETYVSLEEIKR